MLDHEFLLLNLAGSGVGRPVGVLGLRTQRVECLQVPGWEAEMDWDP